MFYFNLKVMSPKIKNAAAYLASILVLVYARFCAIVTNENLIGLLSLVVKISFEIVATILLAAICLALSICNNLCRLSGIATTKGESGRQLLDQAK